jgi:hypothetical protein
LTALLDLPTLGFCRLGVRLLNTLSLRLLLQAALSRLLRR